MKVFAPVFLALLVVVALFSTANAYPYPDAEPHHGFGGGFGRGGFGGGFGRGGFGGFGGGGFGGGGFGGFGGGFGRGYYG